VGEGLGKPGRPYEVTVSYKGYFSDKVVFEDRSEEMVKLTLGDETVPYGLWKSIENMRRGEKVSLTKLSLPWNHLVANNGEASMWVWQTRV
jgi:FKBP-type peptidyl-prolyl cis-trans isomerase